MEEGKGSNILPTTGTKKGNVKVQYHVSFLEEKKIEVGRS